MATNVSSVVSHFPEAENGFTTTTAGSVSSGAATVTLNSVAGYTNGMPVVLVIDPTDASKKQTFTGIVDTAGVQITNVVWTAGTNQTHALGATVVDYATATHISMMSKGILVDHSQSGGHEVAVNYDPNYPTLETQKWVGVSSAVNELTVTNAATGNAPTLSATGGDTNIDLYLSGKGTGSPRFSSPYDGWVYINETITYASPTTFTCSATLAAVLSTGDKIKLTQTSAKYFYVTGISGTTVTVNGGSDYTLANAAITSPYYSKETTPTGFPTYFSYTPTLSARYTDAQWTKSARFSMHGKKVSGYVSLIATNTSPMGGGAGEPTFTLPVTSISYPNTSGTEQIGIGRLTDASPAAAFAAAVIWVSTTTAKIQLLNAAGTYLNYGAIDNTTPITWTTNDENFCQFEYYAA